MVQIFLGLFRQAVLETMEESRTGAFKPCGLKSRWAPLIFQMRKHSFIQQILCPDTIQGAWNTGGGMNANPGSLRSSGRDGDE